MENKYFESLTEVLKTADNQNNKIKELAGDIVKRINGKGKIYIISAGPNADMVNDLFYSFSYLFKFNKEKFLIVQAARKHKVYSAEWKDYENNKSIGAYDATLFKITKDDLIIGLSVTGKTHYINHFIREFKSKGAKTSIITSSNLFGNLDFIDVHLDLSIKEKTIIGLYIGNHTTILKVAIESIFFNVFEELGQIFNNLILTTKVWTKKLFETSLAVFEVLFPEMSKEEVEKLLNECEGEQSVAIVMLIKGISKNSAIKLLKENSYNFKLLNLV